MCPIILFDTLNLLPRQPTELFVRRLACFNLNPASGPLPSTSELVFGHFHVPIRASALTITTVSLFDLSFRGHPSVNMAHALDLPQGVWHQIFTYVYYTDESLYFDVGP